MSSVMIDDLTDDVIASLEIQARRHDRSVAAEARAILEESLRRRHLLVHRLRRASEPSSSVEAGDGPPRVRSLEELELPVSYCRNLERAIEILEGFGCQEVYLFGSLAQGEFHDTSDIDLAVRGCPKDRFFSALGKLLMELEYSVDLVDLDNGGPFATHLENDGELVQIV